MAQSAATLTSLPIEQWIPFISAVAGGILASGVALVGVWLTNRNQRKTLALELEHREKTDSRIIRRDRLEELFTLLLALFEQSNRKYSLLSNSLERKIPYSLALNVATTEGGTADPLPRMQVIVHLYFEELFPSFKKLAKSVTALRQVECQVLLSSEAGKQPESGIRNDLDQAHSGIGTNVHEFRSAIVSKSDSVYKQQCTKIQN